MPAPSKEAIISAALILCEREGLGAVSRRSVAREAGCSKRAVSRHYPNRQALAQAVIEHARGILGEALGQVIEDEDVPLARLERAFLLVLEAGRDETGLAALLTSKGKGALGAALDHLRDAPRALARELIREAKDGGALSAHLSTAGAADAWATMSLGAVAGGLGEAAARSLFAFWRAGLGALEGPEPESAPSTDAILAGTEHIRVLDVRPVLASGRDPLGDILAVLDGIGDHELLVLLTPFRPNPLLILLAKKGFRASSEKLTEACWSIEVSRGIEVEDLRDLEAPLPLERVLTREGALGVDEAMLARLPRYPRMLIGQLEERQVDVELWPRPDGATLLWLRRRR